MATTGQTIDTTPSPEGFARIAHRIAAQIVEDVKSSRKMADTALLVEALKIAGHLARTGNDTILAKLLVAIEQGEPLVLR